MQSIESVGVGDGGIFDGEYHAVPRTLANARVLSAGVTPQIALTRAGQTQARNGFTPTEEMILQAHARRLQLQVHSFSTSNGSVHAFERDILRRADASSASAPPVGPSLTRTIHQVVSPPENGPAASGQLQLLGRLVRTTKSSPEFQFLPMISEDDVVGERWTGETGLRRCLPMAGIRKLTRPTARGTISMTIAPPLSTCPDEKASSGTADIGIDRVSVRSQTLAAAAPCVRLPLLVISRPSSPSSLSSLTADTQAYHCHLNAAAVTSSGTVRSSSRDFAGAGKHTDVESERECEQRRRWVRFTDHCAYCRPSWRTRRRSCRRH